MPLEVQLDVRVADGSSITITGEGDGSEFLNGVADLVKAVKSRDNTLAASSEGSESAEE